MWPDGGSLRHWLDTNDPPPFADVPGKAPSSDPGTTDVDRLAENVAAARLRLTAADLEELAAP
jgi:hypothetical protein